ncbi:MAG: flagellar export protein FliJ [Alphaproteobacteria bacterium]|nr:flagellar export protein FliJ [Alphaproteobacteria bacterium]
MKGLLTLIKLSKRRLDELRRKLGNLEGQKAQLEEVLRSLSAELAKELELAGGQPEMSGFFGGFAKRIQQRQDAIHQEIKKIEIEITKTRDEISDAFSEQKKYEIAADNAKKRAAEEQNRKETLALDEVAEQQHRRKNKEENA